MAVSMPQGETYIERAVQANRDFTKARQAGDECNKRLAINFSFYWERGGTSFPAVP
jgi:hypothetical protein